MLEGILSRAHSGTCIAYATEDSSQVRLGPLKTKCTPTQTEWKHLLSLTDKCLQHTGRKVEEYFWLALAFHVMRKTFPGVTDVPEIGFLQFRNSTPEPQTIQVCVRTTAPGQGNHGFNQRTAGLFTAENGSSSLADSRIALRFEAQERPPEKKRVFCLAACFC